jgi:uncharacterized protein (TIGR04255 family)
MSSTDISFRKAPLLEIVVDLRWQPAMQAVPAPVDSQPAMQALLAAPIGSQQIPSMFLLTPQVENLIHRFGSEVYKRDFQRTERLVPSGFPVLPGQPISRFKKADADNVLYQIGIGMFSANAVPPYRSWSQFAPEVASGVEALLAAREASERERPFSPVSLRYINAFRSDLMGDRDVNQFLREVFNIKLELPEVVSSLAPGTSPKPLVIVKLPTPVGTLQMTAGDANIAGSPGIVLDMNLITSEQIEPQVDAVMKVLNDAHVVIREIFLEMTKPIRALMDPEH